MELKMTKEMKTANVIRLQSAIFHLKAAYRQVGSVYGGVKLYQTIYATFKAAEESLKENESQKA